jgi:hypothetical protein
MWPSNGLRGSGYETTRGSSLSGIPVAKHLLPHVSDHVRRQTRHVSVASSHTAPLGVLEKKMQRLILNAEPSDSGAGMFFSGQGMKASRKKTIKSRCAEDGKGLFFSGTPISSQNGSGGSKKIVRLNNLSTKDAIRQHGKGLSLY